MGARLLAVWRRVPVLVRAPIAAFVVLTIGSTAGALPVFANTRILPGIPWSLPVTLLLMAAFWFYFTGGGYPAATRAARQDVTRSKSLPRPIWLAAVPPLLLSILTVVSLRLALPSILPMQAPTLALDVTSFPLATVIGLLLSIALTAGVTEEVAFRGYLQKPLEDSYGIWPALFVTGLAFWLAHAEKVALSHLPFHLVASILLGFSAYLTGSLLPAIIGHALGDALLLPAYVFHKPAFLWPLLAARPVWETGGAVTLEQKVETVLRAVSPSALLGAGPTRTLALIVWVLLVSAALTVPAFFALRRVVRRVRDAESVGSSGRI